MESVDGVNWEKTGEIMTADKKKAMSEKAMRDDEERKKRETTNTWNIGKSYYYSMEKPWEIYGKSMGNRSSPGQGMKKARQFLALEPLDDEVNQCQAQKETTGFTQDLPWKNVAKNPGENHGKCKETMASEGFKLPKISKWIDIRYS